MRLAIADPPYLGRGALRYGPTATRRVWGSGWDRPSAHGTQTTQHPEAAVWDDPEMHAALVRRLVAGYDGWAIAMSSDSLRVYLSVAPDDARVAVWVNPRTIPSSWRVAARWEPVLVCVPESRRKHGSGIGTHDALTAVPTNVGHTGAKPPQWTRWVLDMLGYDAETDTVDDLFGGSGAVAREIAQGVLGLGDAS